MYNIDWPAIDAYNDPTSDGRGGGEYGMGLGNVPESVAADLASGLIDTMPTRHSLPNPGDLFTNDPNNPANFPPAGNNGPAPDTTTPAGQQPPGGGPPYVPTNQEQGVPPYGNIGFSPTINDLNTLNSFRNPNQKPNPESYTTSPVGLPNPGNSGGTGGTGSGGGGTLSDAQWKQDFIDKFGFFDPRYNSRENMLANAQRGDTVIADQMRYMAGLDSDAKRIEQAIGAQPDFYRSQGAVDWGGQHNAEIQKRIASGEFAQSAGGRGGQGFNGGLGATPQGGGGQIQNLAALANLESQQYRGPANPMTNDAAFPVYREIRQSLEAIGGTNVTMDSYHNIHWDGPTGKHFSIDGGDGIALADWAQRAGELKRIVAEMSAAPPGGGGGGGYGRNYGPPQQQQGAGNYPYQGQVAPFDPNQGTFASVTSGRQIPTAPLPVAGGNVQSPGSPYFPRAY